MAFSPSAKPRQDIIVIGAGVIGLTTANVLQKRLPTSTGRSITIIASEFPTQSPMHRSHASELPIASAAYASMWAGAHHRPIPHIAPSQPSYLALSGTQQAFHSQLARERDLAIRTSETMQQIANANPEAGVQFVQGVEYLENPPVENLSLRTGDIYASPTDNFRIFGEDELDALNSRLQSLGPKDAVNNQVRWACEYSTYVVNVHVYCAYLLNRFIANGGHTVKRKLNTLSDALNILPTSSTSQKGYSPIIVNCSGLNRDTLLPVPERNEAKVIRGQTVLVRNSFDRTITRQCADGTWSFLIPRPRGGGTIVGGTKQIADTETQARPEERQILLENAVRYFPEFVEDVSKFEIVGDNVGQRPWRQGGMRIEIDEQSLGEKGTVVHGYGAGGRGYELSWGAAEEICALVEKCVFRGRDTTGSVSAKL